MSLSTLIRAAAGRRICGLKPEILRRPLPDFERLGLPKAANLAGIYSDSLAGFLPNDAPLEQSSTGSCAAQAWSLAEVITLKARYGIDSPLPSRRAAYYWARFRDSSRITDDGCRPSDLMKAVSEMGLPPENSFPWSIARINQRPPMSTRWDAMDRVGKRDSYQVYYAELQDRIDALQAAVSENRAFLLAIPVGDAFESCQDAATVPWPTESTIRGYHAVCGLGCSSGGVVEIINSWGPGFGVGGRAWLAPEYLAQAISIIVIDPQKAVK
jgi:hypothetical protein